MKKIIIFIFSLLSFLVFTSKVKAVDEYRVYINGANSIEVRKTTGNSSTNYQAVSNYSDILTYSNSVLTLNEGYYFDLISVRISGLTITSNNKHVYLNNIFDNNTSTSNLRNVTIDKLYSNDFVSDYTSLISMSSDKLYSIIYISGNLTITDSNIDMHIVNPKAAGSYYNGDISTVLGDMYVENSTIVSEGGLCGGDGGTFTAKNSTFTATNEQGYGYVFGTFDGSAIIDNSTFNGTIGLALSGDATVTNSVFNLPFFNAYDVSTVPNITIKDCEMNITDSFDIGSYSEYNSQIYRNSANVTLDNTIVKVTNDKDIKIAHNSKLYLINGSSLECHSIVDNHGTSDSLFSIENSEVKTDSIEIAGLINLSDSTITLSNSGVLSSGNTITLDNINDLSIKMIIGKDVSINSTNIVLSESLSSIDELEVIDSNLQTHGIRVSNLTIEDSYLKTETLSTEKGFSPLIVMGVLDITNSRVIASSDGTVPAVLVSDNIVLNNSTFKDNNDKILDVTDVVVSTDNFIPTGYTGNDGCVSAGDTVKTTTLNGVISNYAETAGYYEVTVKVVNGTWEDGTNEDTTVKVLLGDEPDAYLPTSMIANKGYKKGSWKLDDGKYVYTFEKDSIINPKTGVASLTGLLIVSIFLIILLNKYKEKISVFKNI